MRRPGPVEEERARFTQAVLRRMQAAEPVRVQVGFGWTPAAGFINLDIAPLLSEDDHRFDDLDVCYFPYADRPWPLPDNCVDFIFHEDFIEHIGQKQQFCFLAETLRVMQDGAFHRISTPCLAASMQRHSRFEQGMKGVHVGEWDNWQHVQLFTRPSLDEVARIVGYRDVIFTQKNQGVSPHALRHELRPDDDRHPLVGNIFADLLKLTPNRREPQLEQMLRFFDEAYYLRRYGDVAEQVRLGTLANGEDHYVRHGFQEGRMAFAVDVGWYTQAYPLAALQVAYGDYADFCHHYVSTGRDLGHVTQPPG